jgi:hypothetical protein
MSHQSADRALLIVLRVIGRRSVASGYERPEVGGFAREQVDAIVAELRRGGYVDAAWIPQTYGDNPGHWEPSVLTATVRHLLEELESQKG